MKKRLLAIVMSLTMTLSLIPATAMAAGEERISGDQFLGLADEAGTITLKQDMVLTSTVAIQDDLTIALNGHTLTRDTTDVKSLKILMLDINAGAVTIEGPGTVTGGEFGAVNLFSPEGVIDVAGSASLTVCGGAEIKGGKIESNETIGDFATISSYSSGAITIENAKVVGLDYGNRDAGSAVYVRNKSAQVIITDSELIGGSSSNQSAGCALELYSSGGFPAEITEFPAEITNSTLTGGTTERNREGGDALYLSTGTSAIVTGGTITGGQGNSGGKGVNVAGSITLKDVTIGGGASVNSTPGVGVYCTSPAQNVTIIDCTVTGGSPLEGTTTNSAGRGMEIYGPVVLSVENSTIKGGNNNRKGGDIIGGNAIWFYDSDAADAKITLTDVVLGVGNEAAGDAVISGNYNAPAGPDAKIPANITASGKVTVEKGTLKNTTITPDKGGVTIVEKNDAQADVGENNLVVNSGGKVENHGQITYYPTASEAIENAEPGSKITVEKVEEGEKLPAPPAGTTLENKTGSEIQVGDQVVQPDEELKVYVAQVGDVKYTSLHEAIKAAKVGDTVELLTNVTVDSWTQIWNIKGIALDGKGCALKVNSIESMENHDAVFHSAGGNLFQNLTVDMSGITKPSQAQGSRAFSAAPGDSFKNVTIIGNQYVNYGITIGGSAVEEETVVVDGCTFKNLGHAVYDSESAQVENLTIQNSIFTDCDYATILRAENGTFTGNTVSDGKLNIMTEHQTITDNKFTNGSRIKFYADPKTFKKNDISSDSNLAANAGVTGVNVSENYWGGGAPSEEQLGGIDAIGQNVYYEKSTMNPEDLNTYVPPVTPPDQPSGDSSNNERAYAIVTEDDGHGSVAVSADKASAGTRITVTVKPDSGYKLDELTVTDAKNKELAVTKRSESTYTFHMADSKVTVEASFSKDGTVQKPDTRFDDVAKSAWYYKAVEYVAENGIMSGVSAREFAPNAGFSRAMLAQTLYAMSGKPDVKAEGTFSDVAANAWYADAVNWAAKKGYVSGIGDGKFAPDTSVTREQLALILYRYAGSPDVSGMAQKEFADSSSVSAYAVDAIRWAVHEGLISGMENNTLAPQGTATRAQVAQILMNFHQKLDK